MNLRITFFTRGLPFDGRTLHEKALGGSESALYFMARELTALGHEVQVFCDCPRPGMYEGVRYRHLREWPLFAQSGDTDLMIVCRFIEGMGINNVGGIALWQHDIITPEYAPVFNAHAWKANWCLVMSDFQRKQHAQQTGLLEGFFTVYFCRKRDCFWAGKFKPAI